VPRLSIHLRKDSRGIAALEFALTAPIVLVILFNVYDLASYIWHSMAVQNAAQMAVQTTRSTCISTGSLPATTQCSSLNTAVNTAIQSTGLGTKITLAAAPSEGWYCVNQANALQYVNDVSSRPTNCSATGALGLNPGDYITVQVTSNYTPVFANLSVSNLLPTPITASAWMRLQ
jgi:Flp pilus assembly protein TadG